MRQAPSRMENSEWTCRWTKSAANGRLILGRRQDAPGFASGTPSLPTWWPRIVGPRRPEGGPLLETLLFLHILGVFLIVGGAAIATALGIKASKSRRTHTIADLSGVSIVAERY